MIVSFVAHSSRPAWSSSRRTAAAQVSDCESGNRREVRSSSPASLPVKVTQYSRREAVGGRANSRSVLAERTQNACRAWRQWARSSSKRTVADRVPDYVSDERKELSDLRFCLRRAEWGGSRSCIFQFQNGTNFPAFRFDKCFSKRTVQVR